MKIPVSPKDRQRAKESEELWDKSLKEQLIARCERLQGQKQLEETDNQDWITIELESRIEAAMKLLPLPEDSNNSSAVAAQSQTQDFIKKFHKSLKDSSIFPDR